MSIVTNGGKEPKKRDAGAATRGARPLYSQEHQGRHPRGPAFNTGRV